MCILYSVGKGGINRSADVKTIQILINFNLEKFPETVPLIVDGDCGNKTITAIEMLQAELHIMSNPDGRIDPFGQTLMVIKERLPNTLTEKVLLGIMINTSEETIAKYHPSIVSKMSKYKINTYFRACHFLSQIAHESGDLVYSEELASGEAYEYRDDLGNNEPGDGVRFKGRGLIQLTGRYNYEKFGNAIGIDLISDNNHEIVATDPDLAVEVACWFWSEKSINNHADSDNILGVTRLINGGTNGLDDRKEKLIRAKFFLSNIDF